MNKTGQLDRLFHFYEIQNNQDKKTDFFFWENLPDQIFTYFQKEGSRTKFFIQKEKLKQDSKTAR